MGKEDIVVASDEYCLTSDNNTLDLTLNNQVDYSTEISVDWIKLESGTRAGNDKIRFSIGKISKISRKKIS